MYVRTVYVQMSQPDQFSIVVYICPSQNMCQYIYEYLSLDLAMPTNIFLSIASTPTNIFVCMYA